MGKGQRFDVIPFVLQLGWGLMLQAVHLQGKHHLADVRLKELPSYKGLGLSELIRNALNIRIPI
ncbi:hypothetical protein D770_12255 [Flammeovirgaceae bacterium 311]|nr:hypothetical protein D770_12255 [Flammeovirgaceae bacterium 311]